MGFPIEMAGHVAVKEGFMSPIQQDLINEIIRVSQTNFLGRGEGLDKDHPGAHEQDVVEWISNNAATYREYFETRLDSFSARELGHILKELLQSTKSLNEILEDGTLFPQKKQEIPH